MYILKMPKNIIKLHQSSELQPCKVTKESSILHDFDFYTIWSSYLLSVVRFNAIGYFKGRGHLRPETSADVHITKSDRKQT